MCGFTALGFVLGAIYLQTMPRLDREVSPSAAGCWNDLWKCVTTCTCTPGVHIWKSYGVSFPPPTEEQKVWMANQEKLIEIYKTRIQELLEPTYQITILSC
jgi:hypothetical protein